MLLINLLLDAIKDEIKKADIKISDSAAKNIKEIKAICNANISMHFLSEIQL